MRVSIQSLLPCSADAAWEAVQTFRLLEEVAAPLISLHPLPGEEAPLRWHEGRTVRLRPYLFCIIPLGIRTLRFERVSGDNREIQTREFDPLISRWDHHMHFEPLGERQCCYRDEIILEAGWLTPLVWLFAQFFYRHRQRRWRKVAARLAA